MSKSSSKAKVAGKPKAASKPRAASKRKAAAGKAKSTAKKKRSGAVNDDDSLANGVRRKYKYRKLVMQQGVKLPARLAMKMVGPDCAYHLYSQR